MNSSGRLWCLFAAVVASLCGCQRQTAPSTGDVPSSAASSAVRAGEKFVELTAGVDFTCGRSATLRVYCWGSNNDQMFGQALALALGRPTHVAGLDGALAIAAPNVSVRAVCALRSGGQVWCLSTTDMGVAHEVVALDGAETIAVGPAHLCVRAKSGMVRCGRAGLRGLSDAPAGGWPYADPAAFTASWTGWPNGDDVTWVTASGDRLCVARTHAGGQVTCVVDGDNPETPATVDGVQSVVAWDAGICGRAGASWRCSQPLDVTARALMDAGSTGEVFIDGSYPKHLCLVGASGQLDCKPLPGEADWGTSPFAIHDWPVSAVVFGRSHACILGRDGTARCWGVNDEGRLGAGGTTGATGATPIAGLTHVVELVAQDDDYCARRADGLVSCWGKQGGLASETVETRGPTSAVGSAWPFCVQIARTESWTCRRGGYLRGPWAAPLFPSATQVKSLWPYDGLDLHVLTRAGEVFSWTPPLVDPSPGGSAVRFRFDGAVNAQSVSPDGACEIDGSSAVRCRCDRADRSLPPCIGASRSFRLDGLGGVHGYIVHMRNGDVCAMRTDETVACGHDPSVTVHDAVDAAALAAIGRVRQLAQSTELATGGVGDVKVGGYACALAESGQVLCWGHVPQASGGTEKTLVPMRISDLPKAKYVALGGSNGCVLGEDEKVYCWGKDDVGQSSGRSAAMAREPTPVVMP